MNGGIFFWQQMQSYKDLCNSLLNKTVPETYTRPAYKLLKFPNNDKVISPIYMFHKIAIWSEQSDLARTIQQ